jgi:hypothetical protein
MSIVQETIRLSIDINDAQGKYHYVTMPKHYKNYKTEKEDYDLLARLMTGAANSVLGAVNQVAFDKKTKRLADRMMKELAKNNPDMTWTDD